MLMKKFFLLLLLITASCKSIHKPKHSMLTIKAEATPGAEIQKTFKDAIIMAKKLNCWVDFDFNGVKCMASPDGSDEKGAAAYHEAIQSKRDYKIAVS